MRRAKTIAIEGTAIAVVAVVLLLSLPSLWDGRDLSGRERAMREGPVFAPRPPPPVGEPSPEPSDFEGALRAYLDPDGDFLKARTALESAVAALRAEGHEPLARMDALRASVHRARAFPEPPFAQRHLSRRAEFHEDGPLVSLSADLEEVRLRLTLRLPASYGPPADVEGRRRRSPTPLIVTLHEEQDTVGPKGIPIKFPGEAVLARRFDPAGISKAVLEEWAVLAPFVPRGKWILDPAAISFQPVLDPLRAVWERYDVDFERIVIDGGADALTFAAARPHVFAGVIVRGDAPDLDPALVRNLAGMPVYVVGTAESASARTLAANGHPAARVLIGGPDGLAPWLETVRRTTPKSFHWTMKDAGMKLAHWVQITSAEPAGTPTMDVEVVDTESDPNTILLTTTGVRGVAVLLNDDVVDLDRDVRIRVNGTSVRSAQSSAFHAEPFLRLPARLPRSFGVMFATRPLDVRKNLAYGMLFSTILDGIEIPDDVAQAK